MIGKVKIGKSFGGICRYVFEEDKQAEVLAAEGVRTDSAARMAADFNAQRELNPALGRAVMHVALAWPPGEELNNAQMTELACAYLKEMKVDAGNTQWALVASVKSLVQKLSEQPPDVATTRCNPAFRGYQGCLFSKTSVAVAELLAKGSFCA